VSGRIRTHALPTAASEAESWSPECAEAGEEPAGASSAGDTDARRRSGENGEGAVVSAVVLPRLGEATAVGLPRVGEATAVGLSCLGKATAGEAMRPGRGSRSGS
jgi:hypothetical protein